MPGSSYRVAPFLQRLPSLSAAQKAAAVNFGIFPDLTASPTLLLRRRARCRPPPRSTTSAPTGCPALMLSSGRTNQQPGRQRRGPFKSRTRRGRLQATCSSPLLNFSRALASARERIRRRRAHRPVPPNQGQEPRHLRRDQALHREKRRRRRLVIGPFRGSSDADILSKIWRASASSRKWTNSQADRIAPLPVG